MFTVSKAESWVEKCNWNLSSIWNAQFQLLFFNLLREILQLQQDKVCLIPFDNSAKKTRSPMLKQSETQFHSVYEEKKTANGKVLVSHKLLIFQVMVSFCKLGRKMKNSVGKLRDFRVFDWCRDLLELQKPLYDSGWKIRDDQTIPDKVTKKWRWFSISFPHHQGMTF